MNLLVTSLDLRDAARCWGMVRELIISRFDMSHNVGMPVAMESPVDFSAPPHKLWTREERVALENVGVLDPKRYELVGGELVLKMGKNLLRMRAHSWLMSWLQSIYGMLFVMQEPSIDVRPDNNPTSEPQPDAVLMTCTVRDLRGRPGPEQIRLVAEVAGATLSYDLLPKAGLYARAGIAEYCVLDIEEKRVIVHRRPVDGRYLEIVGYAEGEPVATLGEPAATILVRDLF